MSGTTRYSDRYSPDTYGSYSGKIDTGSATGGITLPSFDAPANSYPMAMKQGQMPTYVPELGMDTASYLAMQPSGAPSSIGLGDVGSSAASNAAPAMAGVQTGNPYLAAAGLGLSAVGTVADIYGKYKARDEAKKQYEQQLKIQQEMQRKLDEDRAREEARKSRQEGYFASDFAQGLEDRFQNAYGGYRQPQGA